MYLSYFVPFTRNVLPYYGPVVLSSSRQLLWLFPGMAVITLAISITNGGFVGVGFV